MKSRLQIALIPSLVVFLIIFSASSPAPKFIAFGDLLQKGTIKVDSIIGLGGYQGECVSLYLHNSKAKTIYVKVEAGRRFETVKEYFQDILVVKDKVFAIKPNGKVKVSAFGFCSQSTLASPNKGTHFKPGFVGNNPLTKLAKYLNSSSFNNEMMQSAIWAVSDRKNIASIYSTDKAEKDSLRAFVSRLTGRPLPNYDLAYSPGPNRFIGIEGEDSLFASYNLRPTRLTTKVSFRTSQNSKVSVYIKSPKGSIMSTPLKPSQHNKGAYTYTIDVKVDGWPTGNYTIEVVSDGVLLKTEKLFIE